MSRRVVAVMIALVLALAGVALVLIYVSNADERAIADQDPTSVWVSTKTVPSGTSLRDAERKGLIEETEVPARSVPQGSLQTITPRNQSLLALSDISAGEIVLDARFGETPTGQRAIEVPPGKLAISVELTDPARVGEFVTPGSHIAIYRSYKMVALGDDDRSQAINDNDLMETDVIVGDALVIGVGNSALSAPQAAQPSEEQTDATQQPSFLVTVALPPEQTLRLAHVAMNHELYTALRGSDAKVDVDRTVADLNWPGGLP